MSKIEEKIDEAASFYGNAHAKNALRLNRDVTSFDKRAARFDTYDLETAFEQGARFALSHQWVSVEDELPTNNEDVLVALVNGNYTFVGVAWCSKGSNGTKRWYSDDGNLDMDFVRFWLPIPPLPETRKESEI